MNNSPFFIVGKHAVVEALKNPNRKVLRVFLTEESRKTIHRENQHKNLIKNIKVFFKTKKELDNYCKNDGIQHQGFVAEIEHLEKLELKEFIKKKNNLTLVCLDEVTDPRNIGSIIRSAASFNIDGLIFKDRHFPSNSKLMYKSSSGCMEHLNVFTVSNINTTLKYLKDNNFWVYGFDSNNNEDFTKIEWKGNVVILFGSEGYGIKKHTKKYADFLVKIKINDQIESLNVSNSASIAFHYINKHKK
jgi:23S rRNA (guanosine2251-2'-O)-methyltransferase